MLASRTKLKPLGWASTREKDKSMSMPTEQQALEEIDSAFVWGQASLDACFGPDNTDWALGVIDPKLVVALWMFLSKKSQKGLPS